MSSFVRFFARVGLTSLLAIPPLVFGTVDSKESAPTLGFRWIDAQQDGAVWNKVQAALRDELKPDKADPDTLTLGYKYLKRVGVSNSSALVIVGYRVRERPTPAEQGEEYFLAFNYDLVSGSLSKVVNPEHADVDGLYMWHWKFTRLARFESSPVPDVVFTYLSCWECEPEMILAALRYDSATRMWQIRRWGEGKPEWWMTRVGLVIDMDVNNGGDTVSYDCLYGFLNLKGDGFDNVAIRCKEVTENGQRKLHVADSTVLYSLKGDRFIGEIVATKDQRLKIWSHLCRSPSKSKLCRNVENSKRSRPQASATP
jgi:hypothetical protein